MPDRASSMAGHAVIVADDPLTCVARGGGMLLDSLDRQGDKYTIE